MLTCPTCRTPMDDLTFDEVEVDQCKSCRGIWLDHGEIDQLFSLRKVPQRFLNNEVYRLPKQEVEEGHRSCPRCPVRLRVVDVAGVTLDACPRCRGFFTDLGEFRALLEVYEQRVASPRSQAD